MVPVRQSRKFTIYFFGTVIAASLLLVLVWNGAIKTADAWGTIRIVSGALLFAYVLSELINRWLWRWFPFKQLLGVPNIAGRWEGWYFNTLGKQWLPCSMEIAQSADELTISAYGRNNRSRSLCSSVLVDASGSTDLVWSYSTDPIEGHAAQHRGTAMLQVQHCSRSKILRGTYCTDGVRFEDQTMGKVGFIRFARVDQLCQGGLCYDEGNWGMKKPTESPVSNGDG